VLKPTLSLSAILSTNVAEMGRDSSNTLTALLKTLEDEVNGV